MEDYNITTEKGIVLNSRSTNERGGRLTLITLVDNEKTFHIPGNHRIDKGENVEFTYNTNQINESFKRITAYKIFNKSEEEVFSADCL